MKVYRQEIFDEAFTARGDASCNKKHGLFDELEVQERYSPDTALRAALLLRAVRDVCDGELVNYKQVSWDFCAVKKRQTQVWFRSNEIDGEYHITFLDCCSAIGLDPRAVRKVLHEFGWVQMPDRLMR